MSLSENDQKEILRMRKKLDGIRGPGVRHTRESIYIDQPPRQAIPKARQPADSPFVLTRVWSPASVDGVTLGGGKYLASIGTGTLGVAADSAQFVMPEDMDFGSAATADALFLNLWESGYNTHNLIVTTSQIFQFGIDTGETVKVNEGMSTDAGDPYDERTLKVVLGYGITLNCT